MTHNALGCMRCMGYYRIAQLTSPLGLLTEWGDFGHTNAASLSYPGLLTAAGLSWNDKPCVRGLALCLLNVPAVLDLGFVRPYSCT